MLLGIAATISLCFLLSGCEGMRKVRGEQTDIVDHPVPAVHEVAVAVLREKGLKIKHNRVDEFSALVTGHYADGQDVDVVVERVDEGSSEIVVRAGVFDDHDRARALMAAIRQRL